MTDACVHGGGGANDLLVAVLGALIGAAIGPPISHLFGRAAARKDAARRLRWKLAKIRQHVVGIGLKLGVGSDDSLLKTLGPRIVQRHDEQLLVLIQRFEDEDVELVELEDDALEKSITSEVDSVARFRERIHQFARLHYNLAAAIPFQSYTPEELQLLRASSETIQRNLAVVISRLAKLL